VTVGYNHCTYGSEELLQALVRATTKLQNGNIAHLVNDVEPCIDKDPGMKRSVKGDWCCYKKPLGFHLLRAFQPFSPSPCCHDVLVPQASHPGIGAR